MLLLATGTLSAPDPRVKITARTVQYSMGGGKPITVDGLSGTIAIPCENGDKITGTLQDCSEGGVLSAPFSFSVTAIDSVTVPTTPSIQFSFAPPPTA